MAKTYPAIGPFAPGDILTAATMTDIDTNLENQRVPPACIARRTTDLTSYTTTTNIAWESVLLDTEAPSDPMWASGANASRITIKTAGIYQVSFVGWLSATATMTSAQPGILLNGTRVADATPAVINGGTAVTWYFSTLLVCAASNYLEANVTLSGGSAYIINGSTTSQLWEQTRLCAAWLGQVS